MDDEELARRFRESARGAGRRAPLYRRFGEAIADDPETARLLLHAPADQRMPVLLYACVHWILLREPGHELRRWYPNLTVRRAEKPPGGDPYPAFREFCARNEERLAGLLAERTTQTNEVGRCALFLPVLAEVAAGDRPIAHLDVGASAGLNLLLDRYRYRYEPDDGTGETHTVGGPSTIGGSTVELVCGTRGDVPLPRAVPPIADRIGLDQSPIDVTRTADADWLRACVWPDQADRFDRLDRALAVASVDPPPIVRGDLVDDLRATVARLDPDAHLVVTASWVLNYLDAERRRAFVDTLDAVAADRDLTWCAAESPMLTAELPWPAGVADHDRAHLTHLLRVDWRAGHRTVAHLAVAHPHGYWLHWA